ncbi:MAG: MurR/RpiR family transcriptional regulator [Nitriliruptoraceae bacterium]
MTGTLHRIRAGLEHLNPSEARVAVVMLDAPEAVIEQSITELADLAGTAVSTVSRCCQRLGFSGFQEMKLGLARELAPTTTPASPDADDPGSMLRFVAEFAGRRIAESASRLDEAAFAAAVEAIGGAEEVLVVGFGTSASVALDLAYRLQLLGIRTQHRADPHQAHVVAGSLGPGDACLAISHTGATRETILAAEAAREAGAALIGMTSYHRSPVADLADHPLIAGVRGMQINLALGDGEARLPSVSRLMHLVLGDAIVATLAARDEQRSRQQYEHSHELMSAHLY